MKRILFLFYAVIALTLAACSSDEPSGSDNTPRMDIELSRKQMDVIDAQRSFSINLFKNVLLSSSRNRNHIMSPLSLSLALSMVANGADGETLDEIYHVLCYDGMATEDINRVNRILLDCLPIADGKTRLSIANSLWVDNSLPLNPLFKSNMDEYYDAEIKSLSLSDTNCFQAINSWINSKTEGMIPQLRSTPYPEEIKAMIISILYFKSQWSQQFKKNNTKPDFFNNESGAKPLIDMMDSGSNKYHGFIDTDEGTQCARLSYGNKTYHMTVIMPRDGVSVHDFTKTITSEYLDELDNIFNIEKPGCAGCQVLLPKFTHEANYDMKAILTNMGMVRAFSSSAELSHITGSQLGLMINEISQHNKIIVDEEGTEAASTSKVTLGDTTNFIKVSKIKFDHPFIYYISEQSTGAILFMGIVAEMSRI